MPAALLPMSVLQTNENYRMVRRFPFATLFSRGGFLSYKSQTGKNVKTLMAVCLERHKMGEHPAGITAGELRTKLDGAGYRNVGSIAVLRWGHTYSFEPAGAHVLTLRAELCASWDVAEEGEEPDLVPEAPDSPPSFQRQRGPSNFY